MKKTLLALCTFLLVIQAVAQPIKLRCEYQDRPLGMDVTKPRLSWQVKSAVRNAKQTAYQIVVASTEENLKKDNGDVWNSGKVTSDQSLFVEYKGKALESRKRYFWKVKIWDEKAKPTAWSETAWWEMGLLNKSDWTAHWIGMKGTEGKPPKSVELQKEFNLDRRVTHARVYVSGLGAYHLIMNGKKVGSDILTPGWTNYLKTIHYQTYDVTELMNQGINFITATLGNAWWSSGLGWGGGQFRYSEGPCRLLYQLELTFYDGTIQTLRSDGSWKVRTSAITDNSLYHGENYDARLEYNKDWQNATILDDVTNKPQTFSNKDEKANEAEEDVLFSTANATLKASPAPQIQVIQEIQPISVKEPRNNRWVFDFGQNIVGFVRLKVEGKAGKEVTLKFGELLDEKGLVDQANLRTAKATDTYILKGDRVEEWEPKFTYHGFRYVEMTGFPGKKPDLTTLVAKVIHNAVSVTGTFECSDDLLNKIYKNITWGQRSNLHSVPTDCPQRDERLGWMGDAQIFAPTASYIMDMNSFFAKWVKDITDSQHSSGYVYDVNPKIVVGGPAKPAWGDAVVVVPYVMYQFYGDKSIMADNYEGMKNWVNYLNNHPTTAKDGLYSWDNGKGFFGYGDWVPVEKSPTKPIGGLYQVYSNRLLAEMATVLGKTTDAQQFGAKAKQYADKFNELYFKNGQYEGGTQTANLLPIALGITPEAQRAAVMQKAADNVKAKNNHLSTGFLGTGFLLPKLSDYGYNDLAYQVATQKTYPSWGYMVEKGATTMWELWNSDIEKPEGMNSRNHFAYGSVGEWFYGYLAGIKPLAPGFKKILIAPKPTEGLTWAESNYESPFGKIKSRWENKGGKLQMNVEIPANTTAQVRIPLLGKTKPVIKEGGKALPAKGLTIVNGEAVVEIGAGTYVYTVE
ncbi:MAG: family 78 glycoside hydrolase catalytic domain [Spirosomataceae bacterium]